MLCCQLGGATCVSFFFFFNDTATTEIYTLSLHDALPISSRLSRPRQAIPSSSITRNPIVSEISSTLSRPDRKSTRLNSSHLVISYAVFCLKKKKTKSSTPLPRLSHRRAQLRSYRLRGETP